MPILRSILLALLAPLALSVWPAGAAPRVNVSDHWSAPGEPGWGATVTHQGEVAFVALFVHGPDGQPAWYTAVTTRYGEDMSGNPGFAGPLYRTTGPWQGGAYDASKVESRPVGQLTFEATGPGQAQLHYTVDGVAVVKAVTRFTFRAKDWTGLYRVATRANHRDCQPGYTPTFVYDDGLVEVEHEGTAFRLTFEGRKATCTYAGAYEQHGRVGRVTGRYACSDGAQGTFTLSGLETTESGITGRIDATHPACSLMTSRIGGFLLD